MQNKKRRYDGYEQNLFMEKMVRRHVIVLAAVWVINFLILLIFHGRIAWRRHSWIPAVFLAVSVFNQIASYFERHRGWTIIDTVNYHKEPYQRRRHRDIVNFEFTYERNYMQQFFAGWAVRLLGMPFYLPIMLLVTNGVLQTVLSLAVPIFFTYFLGAGAEKSFLKRKVKREDEKKKRELKKQKEREELGHFR